MSKYDIFISYCRADTRIAQQIYKRFEELGLICFLDAQNLKTGDNFANVIQSVIINSKYCYFCIWFQFRIVNLSKERIGFGFRKWEKSFIAFYKFLQ